MIIDPMLATGSSLIAAIDVLKASGCKDIRVMVLVAAPEGIKRFRTNIQKLRFIPLQLMTDSMNTATLYRA